MPAPKSKATNPWSSLDALFKQEAEPVGPEWFTVEDFAVRYRYAGGTANKKLKDLHAAGKVEQWSGRAANGKRKLKFRVAA